MLNRGSRTRKGFGNSRAVLIDQGILLTSFRGPTYKGLNTISSSSCWCLSEMATPLSIPNRVVKHLSADDTIALGRWESRWTPAQRWWSKNPRYKRVFVCNLRGLDLTLWTIFFDTYALRRVPESSASVSDALIDKGGHPLTPLQFLPAKRPPAKAKSIMNKVNNKVLE